MNVMISPVGFGDLLEDGLEPLLEVAAVLGARDERRHVEADEASLSLRDSATSPATMR